MSKRTSRAAGSHAQSAWTGADWYLGMVGTGGHAYHRHLIFPRLPRWLAVPVGARVLDVGCGPAPVAPLLRRQGWQYTGVDASPQMIAQARKLHARQGEFLLGDARELRRVVRGQVYDAALFLLSVQDMHPLGSVLMQAAQCLRPGGTLLLVMTHPCFRVPRYSGWEYDQGRQLHYRRVDRYLTPLPVSSRGKGTTSYHRPLQDYVAALHTAGLTVLDLQELAPTPALLRQLRQTAGNADIPALLILKAGREATRQPLFHLK